MSENKEIKNITIDELAIMMNASFEDLRHNLGKKIDDVKDELDDFKKETTNRFDTVDERLDRVDERLERIEDTMFREDRQRLERLEDKMVQVEVILGKKL
ncbi:MAG: hypothetical protein K0S38_111 [Candidatus Paceibacter sp.]|jgi:uncharacterized membrane-anchored protein YhcB (DUF1043 family)|nr:hypothetical protein [Candidatus Paceibacter sp.]